MSIFHIVPGTDDAANGMAVVARLLAKEQGDAEVVDLKDSLRILRPCDSALKTPSEVWVHGMWLPKEWMACWRALRAGKRLVRMTHGSLSPLYLKYQSPLKKRLVGPIERFFLRRCAKIVATCEAEKGWIEKYLGKRCPEIEVTDIKRFFELGREFGSDGKIEAWRRGFQPRQLGDQNANSEATLTRQDAASPKDGGDGAKLLTRQDAASPKDGADGAQLLTRQDAASPKDGADGAQHLTRLEAASPIDSRAIHLLYLGRRHPLKGVEYLEAAVAELNSNSVNSVNSVEKTSSRPELELRIVSSVFGEELEKVWDWCDVLVLPTLSENFGLVIAEALERGKRVITTDGAPAWGENLSRVERVECVDGGIWSGYGGRLVYLKGYRDGTPTERVELLKHALSSLVSGLTSK